MLLNIAICDDDLKMLNTLEDLINQYCKKNMAKTEISHFESGEAFCNRGNFDQYDILFLDIKMDELTGMDVAEKLREVNSHTRLIFVTSYDEYTQELFRYDTSEFIKKLVTEERFNEVFEYVSKKLIRGGEKFYYSVGKVEKNILKREILYFESDAHKVVIYKTDQTQEQFYGKLKDTSQYLSELDFLRVAQSYIVNMDNISKMRKTEIDMIGGNIVPISRKYRDEVMRTYMKYRNNKSRGR